MSENKKGWECPRCGRVNAPDVKECPCSEEHKKTIEPITPVTPVVPSPYEYVTDYGGYNCCRNCSNNPANNPLASGVCCCSLPAMERSHTTGMPTGHSVVYTYGTTTNGLPIGFRGGSVPPVTADEKSVIDEIYDKWMEADIQEVER